jgi:hypothetical protein
MAYSAPRTWTTGDLATAAMLNQDLRDNVAFLANPPACRVYKAAVQSLTNNSEASVIFDTERYDTNSMHDTVTNNTRITFNTAGLYVITCCLEMVDRTDYTEVYAFLRLNGAGNGIAIDRRVSADAADLVSALNLVTTYKFAAADYVEVRIRQSNVAAAAANLSAIPNRSAELTATWVGLG